MRITTLELENFRCFEKLTLELHPEFTLLVGVNATGKTAVLDALATALTPWIAGFQARNYARTFEESDQRLVRTVQGGISSLEAAGETSITATALLLDGLKRSWTQGSSGGSERANEVSWLAHETRVALQSDASIVLPVLAYYDTMRLWAKPARKEPSFQRVDVGYENAMRAAANSDLMTGWLAWRESVRLQELSRALENGLPLEVHNDPLLDVVADTAVAFVDGAKRLYYSYSEEELRIDFADGRTLPFNLLSDGTRNLLALAGDIAWRAARLNPHHGADAAKKATGVVLIDEIDLHLHPTWQRRVIPDLRRAFPGIQFVATTHSPQVLSTAEPEWIRILHADGRVETVTHTLGRDSNSLLEDVFEVSERPEEMRAEIAALFDLIDRGALDEAEAKWARLHERLGPDDPDLVRARTMLDLEKMPLLPDGDG